ncbi:MAG: hypothetical protein NVS4B3_04700 [Gemmatimonadaceae bacterium]
MPRPSLIRRPLLKSVRRMAAAPAGAAGLLMSLSSAPSLAAQVPGLGLVGQLVGARTQIVYDPTAVAKLITQARSQLRQLVMQREQLAAQLASMQKLSSPSWRRIDGAMGQIDAMLANGRSLAYTLRTVDADFRRTFPGDRAFIDYPIETRVQTTRTLATLRGALNAAGRASRDFPANVARLERMKGQLGTVRGHQQVLELNGTIGMYGAEELTMLRQAVAALTNVEAVYFADQVNSRAQQDETVRLRLASLSAPGLRYAPISLVPIP